MPQSAAPARETALISNPLSLTSSTGREGGRKRRRGYDPRRRRVQRECAHGRGGDAEGIGLRGLGLRVFLGRRSGSASTSHLTADGIRQLVDGALALAKVKRRIRSPGCRSGEFGKADGDLHLYFDDVYSLEGAERIEWARRAEAAAMAADPRITNSDGGSFDVSTGQKAMANSRGFVGSYRTSYAGVAAAPLATDANGRCSETGGGRPRGGSTFSRHLKLLAPRRQGGPCAGRERGACLRSGFRLCSLRRPRGRSSAESSRLLLAIRSGAALVPGGKARRDDPAPERDHRG